MVKAENNVPSRTPSISENPVRNRDITIAVLTRKMSKKVLT